MTGHYFVYVMMTLNAGACLTYLYSGDSWRALYWIAAFTLNLCVLNLK